MKIYLQMLVGKSKIKKKSQNQKSDGAYAGKLVNIFCNLYKLWWRMFCSEERKKRMNKFVVKGF